jgi:phosphatidylserine/phosphatidylglycerophosphate/cardiolipin synthase-like enzyme
MNQVIKDFEQSTLGTGQAKIAQWNVIKNNLVAKHSMPYHEDGPQDFMHNKVLVVDQQVVVTGSYNFSQNAMHKAEYIITLYDESIARQYEQ